MRRRHKNIRFSKFAGWKWRNAGLIVLTLVLTFLSLKGQYQFFIKLWDLETAVIGASIFEVLRLATLYGMVKWEKKRKVVGTVLYVLIALYCGSICATSWMGEIIESKAEWEDRRAQALQVNIDKIKQAYAENVTERLGTLEREITWCENQIAKNPASDYWSRRRDQFVNNRESVLKERDAFLYEKPENPEQWIEKNKALLQMELDVAAETSSKSSTIEMAIMKIWKLDSEAAKKLVAIIFVVAIEVGIVFLAMMTEKGARNGTTASGKGTILEYLQNRFDDDDIQMFVAKTREKYQKTGQLPKASELTEKLRPIRYEIVDNGFDAEYIKALFDSVK